MSMFDGTYFLHFTGNDDPRDCIIMGDDTKPVYLEFQTPPSYMADTRTTVYRNNKETVAYLDWTMGVHLGRVTIGSRQMPMSDMLLEGLDENARLFYSYDGNAFEWRKCHNDAYDLYLTPDTKVASFRRAAHITPIGPSHGYLCYSFSQDRLLLDVLVSLCLNRWLEWHGM